jgi:hypothetical protein
LYRKLLFFLTGVGAEVGDTPELNKGLVFLRERELLVTGNYWNVVINFDVQWYQNTLQVIEQVFKQPDWNREHRGKQTNLIDWEDVDQVRRAINKVNQELLTFSKLLPPPKDGDSSHRKKRGLINIGGDILKFVFGLATMQQVQDLHATVEGIKTREGKVIHAVQKKLTYLKSISEATAQNTIGFDTVARILKNVMANAFTLQKTFTRSIQDLKTILFSSKHLASHARIRIYALQL